jgi:hypothetical protein
MSGFEDASRKFTAEKRKRVLLNIQMGGLTKFTC